MGGCCGKTPDNAICYKCNKTVLRTNVTEQITQITTGHDCPLSKPIIRPKVQVRTPQTQLVNIQNRAILDQKQRIKIKVPKDKTKTKFVWKNQQALFYPIQLKVLPRHIIKYGNFQQKLTWFRLHLQTRRISWQKGSDVLKVDRWNLLFTSLEGLKKVNLYKQLKIQFSDEKVDDAGGLLREWMHLCIKQIMSKQTGIFKQCNTDETAYKFIWDKNVVEQLAISALNLLGLIIGKALFQRISLNCYLDRTILRQLCSQPVHIQDIYSYDKTLYQSWSSILQLNNVQQLVLDGCVYHTHGQNDLQRISLFPNGQNIIINNQNRDLYITEIIHLYCTKSILIYLQALKKSVFKVIPSQLLSIFQPHQLQMILNGPTIIDVHDWKNHTIYQGYKKQDQVIRWFWQNVESYDQEGLKNLLHYCTGSARVPVLGFRYLESNRGEIRQFTIRKVEYQHGNPFPKSHTCFNRLEIPVYKTKQQLQTRFRVIMVQEINHFGLS